jgi:hypothetical protein
VSGLEETLRAVDLPEVGAALDKIDGAAARHSYVKHGAFILCTRGYSLLIWSRIVLSQ